MDINNTVEINPENLFKSNDIIIIDETYGNGEENSINEGAVYLRAFEKQLCNLAKTNKLSIFLEDCDKDLNGKQILNLVFEKDKEKAKVLQRVYNAGAKLLAIGHETEYSKINKYIVDIAKKISTLQKNGEDLKRTSALGRQVVDFILEAAKNLKAGPDSDIKEAGFRLVAEALSNIKNTGLIKNTDLRKTRLTVLADRLNRGKRLKENSNWAECISKKLNHKDKAIVIFDKYYLRYKSGATGIHDLLENFGKRTTALSIREYIDDPSTGLGAYRDLMANDLRVRAPSLPAVFPAINYGLACLWAQVGKNALT